MSLRIRRGTEEQRTGVAFDSGELVVTTDEFRLYVGDGITQGGRSIASNLGGNSIVFNEDTGRLDLSLNITADDVPNGVNNKYFSTELAQDAAASMLTLGQHTGISFSYTSTQDSANRIDATVSLDLNSLSDVVITDTPTNGQVLKYNSVIGKWTAGSDSGAGGGLDSLQDDLTPTLGGDLTLSGYDIIGLGDVNITGNIDITGEITALTGLGSNLPLNGFDIVGTGNVDVVGNIDISGTLSAAGGLGANLDLNNYDINGLGNIDISGTLSAAGGLGANLDLNNFNIIGTGIVSNGSLTFNESRILSSSLTGHGGGFGFSVGLPNPEFGTTLRFTVPDAVSPIYVRSIANSFDLVPRVTFEAASGTISTPVAVTAGQYLTGFAFNAIHPTSGSIPSSSILARVDPDGIANSEVTNGKIEILTGGGTSSGTFQPNYLVFDSKGQLGVNTQTASATLDVNGFAKLAILTTAPASPANGMIAIANGTSWDPVSNGKQSLVIRLGGNWVLIAAAA